MPPVYRQQITKPAAILPAPVFARQRRPAHRAFFCPFLLWWVCLVVLPPPFDPARVTAILPWYPAFPFRLEFLPAIRTDLLWTPLCHPPLLDLSLIVFHPASVAAKPPPPPRPLCLLYLVPTLRADIYRHPIVSFRAMISVPARITAKFLPCYMARWDKPFSTILALQFFRHPPFTPFLPILP